MESSIIPSLYLEIEKNIKKKPYKVLGVTKNLTISNDNYTDFYKSSIDIFQKKTFKIPDQTKYPLLRESKKKYISIRTRLNTFSFKDKRNKPRILIPKTAIKRNRKLFSVNSTKTKKNVNFFICDENYIEKKKKNVLYFNFYDYIKNYK